MKYEITKEQINELLKESDFAKLMFPKWIPEAFETKLEVGKWHVGLFTNDKKTLWFFNSIDEENNIKGYGFNSYGKWDNDINDDKYYGSINHSDDWRPATESEVFEVLKKEAVKRGYIKGAKVRFQPCNQIRELECDDFRLGSLTPEIYLCNGIDVIFSNGEWQEIIKEKTLSKSEAEAKLNELIKDGYAYKIG